MKANKIKISFYNNLTQIYRQKGFLNFFFLNQRLNAHKLNTLKHNYKNVFFLIIYLTKNTAKTVIL